MTFKPHPIHLAAGLSVWFIYFIIVYGGMSVGCSFSEASALQHPWTWINAFVIGVTAVFTSGLAWAAWKCHRVTPRGPNQPRFLLRMAAVLYAVSALATLLVGLPAILYPPCL